MQKLDEWAWYVKAYSQKVAPKFERDPEQYENSPAYFRLLTMVTALQKGLGVRYNPELIDRDDFFQDARNLFIHGILMGHGGSCSSLPPLYVAIGRRLGYPLKLVSTKCHVFARWDDPQGERWNIECSGPGLNCFPDDYYRQWPLPITPEEEKRFCWLKSKTPREELSLFLGMRGHCWQANGRYREAAACFAWAAKLEPGNELPVTSASAALQMAGLRSRSLEAIVDPSLVGGSRAECCPELSRLLARMLAFRFGETGFDPRARTVGAEVCTARVRSDPQFWPLAAIP
jgi:hypothetical protein